MAFVFDGPVAAIGVQQILGVSLIGRPAGNAQGRVVRWFAAFFIRAMTLDEKSLLDVREVQVLVECGGGPDPSLFDAAVIGRVAKDEIGSAAVFKEQFDIFEDSGLVFFDGEVVVSLSILDDVIGQATLGQQGICGDVFVFDIDGIEQGPGGFDFVGSLDLLIVCSQAADFFWV